MESVKYEPTINLGQVGTMVTVAISVLTVYAITYKSLQYGEEARTKYIPIIEKLVETQNTITNRQENQGDAILQMRSLQQTTSEALGKIAIDLAIVKTNVENRMKGPN
jgi:hypothetical protein